MGENLWPDTVIVSGEALAMLIDNAVQGDSYASGWWDTPETDNVRALAELLGICPNAVTPDNHLDAYPRCEGIVQPEEYIKGYRSALRHTAHGPETRS